MSVIKARLREQAAKFISLRETLELMTKAGEGCTMKEAATFLYQAISKQKSLRWRTILYGEISEADNGYTYPLLDVIVKNSGLAFAFDDFYSLSDCDQYGFLWSELIDFLSDEGIHLSEKSSPIPEWAKSCKAIKRFTLGQAARVLAGIDPMDRQWPGDDGQRELEKAGTALSQAADDDELLPVGRDDNDCPLFRVQDLRAWAASVGLEWCIPCDAPADAVMPAGASDEATQHRLRQLEAENDRLVERVADLETELSDATEEVKYSQRRLVEVFDQRDELQRQLQEATAALQQAPQEMGAEPQQATAAPQDDDEDPLHPRREMTYLNTIGALVDLIQSPGDGRDSNAAVIRELVETYGDRQGISKRTLETIFPLAERNLKFG